MRIWSEKRASKDYFLRAGEVAQAVAYLPNKCEALNSNPSTATPPQKKDDSVENSKLQMSGEGDQKGVFIEVGESCG
jgi:hypothetical protein